MDKILSDIFSNDDIDSLKKRDYTKFFEIDGRGWTYLHYAAQYDSVKIAEFLISQNIPIDVADSFGLSALHICCMCHSTKVLPVLLPLADINQKSLRQFDALMIASWFNNIEAARLLLENGADYEASSVDGWSAVHYATWAGNISILQNFIDKKEKFSFSTKSGLSIVDIAILNKNLELASQLITILKCKDEYPVLESHIKIDMFISNDEDGLPKIILDNTENKEKKSSPTSFYTSQSLATEAEGSVGVSSPAIAKMGNTGEYRFDISVLDNTYIEEFLPVANKRFRGYSGQYYTNFAEMMIANLLMVMGFRFDYKLAMQGTVKRGEMTPAFTFYDSRGDVMIWLVNNFDISSEEWKRDFLWYQGNGFNYEVNFFATFNTKEEFDCLGIYAIANMLKERV